MTGWALRRRRPGSLLGGATAASASTTTLRCGRYVDTSDRVGGCGRPDPPVLLARKPQQPQEASALESRAQDAVEALNTDESWGTVEALNADEALKVRIFKSELKEPRRSWDACSGD